MDDKVTDANKRYCAVCINRGRTERDTDEGGIMHCRVYNLTGEKICIEKGYISFERDSQAQEAPRDFTVQEFAALPKKFRDHYLRMAAELSARDMEASQAQEAPKAEDLQEVIDDYRRLTRELDVALNGDGSAKQASLCDIVAQVKREKGAPKAASQSAEELLESIEETNGMACLTPAGKIALIEADRAAQRSKGAEDIASAYGDNLRRIEQRYTEVVDAARDYLKEHACSNSQGTCQDETNLRKALSALDEARKG